nr:immunoglobulin heavy chain junction region [Mus musculus]MBK4196767.1 immunoglobulin heavy chain junction region [Mus musculus]
CARGGLYYDYPYAMDYW